MGSADDDLLDDYARMFGAAGGGSVANTGGNGGWNVQYTTYAVPMTEATEEQKRLKKVEESLEVIKERLAILDEPSPEKLELHKSLKEAYLKYKMIEKLIGETHERNRRNL